MWRANSKTSGNRIGEVFSYLPSTDSNSNAVICLYHHHDDVLSKTVKTMLSDPPPVLKGKEARTFLEEIAKPPTERQKEVAERALREFRQPK